MIKKVFLVKNKYQLLGFAILVILSLSSSYVSFKYGYQLAYNDSMSHLNIARFVIDNLEPGFAQLGGVWLPFNHVLYLPLIWNDWAWHSGFAGSSFSMIAYIISALYVYKIVIVLTQKKIAAGIVGTTIFAFNLNNLYLQTTALTESLFLMLVILSFYYVIKYFETENVKFLIPLGLIGFLQVLTRYDGWFVAGIEGIAIFIHHLLQGKSKFSEALGKTLFYALPVIFGLGLWFLWNFLIYNDPFYFLFGPYSAHSQQEHLDQNSGLTTKYNLLVSMATYFTAAVQNLGILILFLAMAGCLAFLIYTHKKNKEHFNLETRLLISLVIAAPIMFNILALFLGFSILTTAPFDWNPFKKFGSDLFNVRYGIMALPFAAIFIGYIARWSKYFIGVISFILIFQTIAMSEAGIITLIDGTVGASSFAYDDLSHEISRMVKEDEKIMLSISFYNPVVLKGNTQVRQIVHEGVSKQWNYALVDPKPYAQWIVMASGDVGEPVFTSLMKKRQGKFLEDYSLFFRAKHADLYKLKELP